MGEVVYVDFNTKKILDNSNFEVKSWKCLVCNKTFQISSSLNVNSRVIIRNATNTKLEECICKNCSLDVVKLVSEQSWEKS